MSSEDYHARRGQCVHTKYELTCSELDTLYVRSGGFCEICRGSQPGTVHKRLYIDHLGYVAGPLRVRGLLCSTCNTRLRNGVPFNEEAAAYLALPPTVGTWTKELGHAITAVRRSFSPGTRSLRAERIERARELGASESEIVRALESPVYASNR